MRRSGFGISVDVPPGWSTSLVRRAAPSQAVRPPAQRGAAPGARMTQAERESLVAADALVERSMPVLHVSNRGLPASVGDFGQGAVELLDRDDLFIALVEYGSDLADTGLFAKQGMPRLAPSQFDPGRMPRHLPGRSASQHFFSVGGRAFCLYTVVGSHARRMVTVRRAATVARSLGVESAATMRAKGVSV